jgi:rubrerythrin
MTELERMGRELARLEERAETLRDAMTPLLVEAYRTDERSVPEIAAEASLKRTRVFAWLKRAGVKMDRGAGNRFTSGRRPAQGTGERWWECRHCGAVERGDWPDAGAERDACLAHEATCEMNPDRSS